MVNCSSISSSESDVESSLLPHTFNTKPIFRLVFYERKIDLGSRLEHMYVHTCNACNSCAWKWSPLNWCHRLLNRPDSFLNYYVCIKKTDQRGAKLALQKYEG